MVSQYPYELWVKTFEGQPTKDGNGNYIAATPTWTKFSICRDEDNTQGQTITLEDQTIGSFDSLVQLPLSCPTVSFGSAIEVRDSSGNVRVSAKAKRFRREQMHCRLWV